MATSLSRELDQDTSSRTVAKEMHKRQAKIKTRILSGKSISREPATPPSRKWAPFRNLLEDETVS